VTGTRWDDYEDAELVVETLVGNIAAFDALVVRYRTAVLATVLRQVPARPIAEDICQEAFLRAFRALARLREPQRFAAWLHAIARREVIRHAPVEARAADHATLDEPLLEQGVGQDASGWESLERREEGESIRRAMASLPEEFQLVLTLRYWADLPLEQIAAYLDRPLTTIKWRLHRARALMKQRLTQPVRDGPIRSLCPSGIPPSGNHPSGPQENRGGVSRPRTKTLPESRVQSAPSVALQTHDRSRASTLQTLS
jgi:RNA polymerase sigma-70 factor (ECF subfamily)